MSELRHLEVFRAVARSSSFTQAATELHVSQPVVSRTVRDLERSLGVALFERTTRSVVLTPEGRELLVAAEELLDRFGNVLGRFAAYCRGERGRIVIAALPSMAAGVLPSILADFIETYPAMSVEILDVPTTEAIDQVLSGKADLAIAEPANDTEGLTVRLIYRDRFVAVLPSGHPLTRHRTITWQSLAAEPFVTMSRGTSVRRLTDLAMAQAGVAPTTVVEARNIATAGGIIAAGLGVSAFPELVLPLLAFAPTATRPLRRPVMHRDIAVITLAGRSISPPAQRFVEILCSGLALSSPIS